MREYRSRRKDNDRIYGKGKSKGKAIPVTGREGP
jgi:hypothetical protein